jgi:hypothetical protein
MLTHRKDVVKMMMAKPTRFMRSNNVIMFS